jgi:copper transport protein
MSRAFAARGLAAMLALMVLLGFAGSALAHASLIRSSPADGGTIAAAPAHFELTFNEPVAPLVLKLVPPTGTAVSLMRSGLQANTLSIDAPPGLGNGTYALSWRVVSADGHPIGGTLVFSIGAPSVGTPPNIADAVNWPARIAFWTAKMLLYAGLFIGVGGAFFAHWVGGDGVQSRRLAGTAMALGLVAAVASLGLQGIDALDAGLGSLGRAIVWRTGFNTSYGTTAAIAAGTLIGGLIALGLRGTAAKLLSLLALIGVGAALSASGHASAALPQWLTRPAVFLHAVGIAFWAGALMPLGVALTSPGPQATDVLRRFSRGIPFAVLPLIASGIALAVLQLQSIDALWTTAYGQVFLVKLAVLAPLFALAALNRFRLTQPAGRGDMAASHALRRSILLELMLFLAIFGVAASWRFTPPPRSLAEAASKPATIHIHTEKAMADLTITPGRVATVTTSIVIMTGDFALLPAKEVALTLANPIAGIEPITRPALQSGDGTWQVTGMQIPAPGRWSVRIEVLISDFEMARLEGEIDIRR